MSQPSVYLVAGRPGTGKTALALWLCRRLPGPLTGVRVFCTGRSAVGPRFSAQNLANGEMIPLDREEAAAILPDPRAAARVAAALTPAGSTVLVDEAGHFAGDPDCRARLQALAGAGPLVLTLRPEEQEAVAPLLGEQSVCWLDLDTEAPDTLRQTLAQTLPAPLHAGVSVRLFREEKCFGPGPWQLLELVGRTGSLHRAAAAMGMAYSKAWKMLGELERQWGFAMLERRPGGTGGGGSLLTDRAWELLGRYRALQWETDRAAQRAFARHFARDESILRNDVLYKEEK